MPPKRKHELIEVHSLEGPLPPINWEDCILCQTRNDQPLIKPTTNGHESLAKDLSTFAKYESLPRCIRSIDRLDEGSGVLQTLLNRNAKYHKLCRSKYDSYKAQRTIASKRANKSAGRPSSLPSTSSRPNRSSSTPANLRVVCIFCDLGEEYGHLVSASTLGIGPSIHENAVLLKDETLLTKLYLTDMVALEAKYHKACHTTFFTRARSAQRDKDKEEQNEDSTGVVYGSVISELVDYIKDMYLYSESSPVFKLSYLTEVTAQRMTEMGVSTTAKEINRTRLKDHLISFVPGLRADKSGREILLSFEGDVGDAIKESCSLGAFSDGLCLGRAAALIRKTLFCDFPQFKGSFSGQFVPSNSVPVVLLHFISMLLEGPHIEIGESNVRQCQNAALSISQLIRFNSVKSKRKASVETPRHQLKNETPLPLYLGIMIHNVTKKKKIVNQLCKLGLSVSYDRVQEVSATMTNALCEKFNEDGVVSPHPISPNVFITAAIDNIDHNQSSNTAHNSFHGSSVTVIQHPRSSSDVRTPTNLSIEQWTNVVSGKLPSSYTNVTPLGKVVEDPPLHTVATTSYEDNSFFKLDKWLNSAREMITNDELNEMEQSSLSFAAFHSRSHIQLEAHKSHSTLLPLFHEEIASSSMVKHLMNVVITATSKLNNGQTSVITADQPVYTISKQIQWRFPNTHGEDKVIIMMGALHIEMMLLNMLGKWLVNSGWTDTLVQAGVTSQGVAEACLTSSHVKRARYAHEITIVVLYILQEQAYIKYCEETHENEKEEKAVWKNRKVLESPQFNYWNIVFEIESLLLQLIFSIRTANFKLYVVTLKLICPWTFALDAVHYSRWLPVFVRDLEELPDRHPDVYAEFLKGNFTSRRTTAPFSAMSDDQFHEQNNKKIKCDGGAVGIFDNETALLKWMISGPDMSRVISEFEDVCSTGVEASKNLHHENTPAFEKRFKTHVKNLLNIMNEEDNPFECNQLVAIGSRKLIAPKESVLNVEKAHSEGLNQYKQYIDLRLIKTEKSIHDVICRNNCKIFNVPLKAKSKVKAKICDLRRDSNLFCKMYVAAQHRETDVGTFFSHENQVYPPSISEGGRLRKPSNKADIVHCMENYLTEGSTNIDIDVINKQVTAAVLDGAVIVHLLPPKKEKTFLDYYTNTFKPYIHNLLKNLTRVDVVFDRYCPESLKSDTRQSRGTGTQIRVTSSTAIPRNFYEFLRVDENKVQLFTFLSSQLTSERYEGKTVVCTLEENVITSVAGFDVCEISPSWHEEADGRILLHVKHAADNGHEYINIRTVDSDVVVVAISVYKQIVNIKELWIDFGTGKHRRMIPVHVLCSQLSPEICNNLPIFHAITGCDTVSAFHGIGKKRAWKVWMAFPNVNSAFEQLLAGSNPDDESVTLPIQRFVVLLYDITSHLNSVNDCRRVLFINKNRAIENIPPTENALCQHVKRATLQGSMWMHCLETNFTPPPPAQWGWKEYDKSYSPVWSTIPEASKSCEELYSCVCKKRCSSCVCVSKGLLCTLLCSCEGHCSRNDV